MLWRLFYIILFGSFISLSNAQAKSVHGVVKVVKGDVQILSGSTNTMTKAKIGTQVHPGDTIIAGKDSRAKIIMIDKNEISISPDSKVVIQNYEYKSSENKKNVLLDVLYGKVRAKVSQKYDNEKNKFQVKTPSAVAGVRGTDFITSYDRSSDKTQIVTFEGTVSFGKFGPGGAIVNTVQVSVGQMTTSIGAAAPEKPIELPKGEIEQMAKQSDASAENSENREPSSAQPDSNKEKDKEKKQDQEPKENKNASNSESKNAAAAPGRLPASTSNMMISEDMPAQNPDIVNGALPIAPVMQIPIAPLPVPKCEFCNQVIETRQTSIKVEATIGN